MGLYEFKAIVKRVEIILKSAEKSGTSDFRTSWPVLGIAAPFQSLHHHTQLKTWIQTQKRKQKKVD